MAVNKGQFYKMPKNIFEMIEQQKLSILAVNIYMLIVDRQNISKFKDENGSYAIYTIKELQKKFNIKTENTIYKSLNELIENRLITVKKNKGVATKYYLK